MRLKFKSDAELLRYLRDEFMAPSGSKTRNGRPRIHPGVRASVAEIGLIAEEIKNTTLKLESMTFRVLLLVFSLSHGLALIAQQIPDSFTVQAGSLTEEVAPTPAARLDREVPYWADLVAVMAQQRWLSESTNGEKHDQSKTANASPKAPPTPKSSPYQLIARDNSRRTTRPGEGAGQVLPMLIDSFGSTVQAKFYDGRWHTRSLD